MRWGVIVAAVTSDGGVFVITSDRYTGRPERRRQLVRDTCRAAREAWPGCRTFAASVDMRGRSELAADVVASLQAAGYRVERRHWIARGPHVEARAYGSVFREVDERAAAEGRDPAEVYAEIRREQARAVDAMAAADAAQAVA